MVELRWRRGREVCSTRDGSPSCSLWYCTWARLGRRPPTTCAIIPSTPSIECSPPPGRRHTSLVIPCICLPRACICVPHGLLSNSAWCSRWRVALGRQRAASALAALLGSSTSLPRCRPWCRRARGRRKRPAVLCRHDYVTCRTAYVSGVGGAPRCVLNTLQRLAVANEHEPRISGSDV